MSDIYAEDVYFRGNITEKYYGNNPVNMEVHLTREEAEFVSKTPSLRIGIQSNAEPVSYVNSITGEVDGIEVALLDEIAALSGLKFEYFSIPDSDKQYNYEYFRKNGVDLIAGIEENSSYKDMPGINLTNAYFTSQLTFVSLQGHDISLLDTFKVGVVGSSGVMEPLIANNFPNFTTKSYVTIEECLDAMERGERVLVCEDHPINMEILKRLLKKVNCKADFGENGQLGIESLQKHPRRYYNLILTDIRMPVMDGYEMTSKIRHEYDTETYRIPIIALTSNVFEDETVKIKEAGMDEYLTKPIDTLKLYVLLDKYNKRPEAV